MFVAPRPSESTHQKAFETRSPNQQCHGGGDIAISVPSVLSIGRRIPRRTACGAALAGNIV